MTLCAETKYSEEDAKNKAVLKTRSLRNKQSKVGNELPQAKAYKCDKCNAWHVKMLFPKKVERKPVCPELSYTPS